MQSKDKMLMHHTKTASVSVVMSFRDSCCPFPNMFQLCVDRGLMTLETLETTENGQNVQQCQREKYETSHRNSSEKGTAFTAVCQFNVQEIIGIPHPSVQNKLLRFGKRVRRTWEKPALARRMQS